MEPNKFEQIAKEKLAKREVKPSDAAWDRLDAMLATQEQPNKKNNFWLYIAASLFVIFGISYWFIQSNTNKMIVPENKMVSVPEVQSDEVENNVQNENNSEVRMTIQNELRIAQKGNINYAQSKEIPKVAVEDVEITLVSSSVELSVVEKGEEYQYQYVTPEELLASVEGNYSKEAVSEKTKNKKNALKVSADELLSSVEGEIQTEYRESTLDKISKNYNKVKSALASRNYQE